MVERSDDERTADDDGFVRFQRRRRARGRGDRGVPGAGRAGPGARRSKSSPRVIPSLKDDVRAALEGLELVHGLAGARFGALGSGSGRGSGSDHRIESGRRIAGYRVVRELGRGGMGTVYEAVHVGLDRPVALKVLGIHAAPDSSARRRFLNEARTAAGLHHTHIVPVFDVGQVGGLCYYAMQRIEGSGLDRVVRHLRRSRPSCRGAAAGRPAAGSAAPTMPGVPRARRRSTPGSASSGSAVSSGWLRRQPRRIGGTSAQVDRGRPSAPFVPPAQAGPVARRALRSRRWAIRRPRGVSGSRQTASARRLGAGDDVARARRSLAGVSGDAAGDRPRRAPARRRAVAVRSAARIGLFSLGRRGRPSGGRCAGARPPPGCDPPRRQAVQPADRRQGKHLGHRLRPGSPAGRPRADPPRQPARHAAVHESRAGPDRLDRRADRRLQPGSDALRALDACGRRSTVGPRPS